MNPNASKPPNLYSRWSFPLRSAPAWEVVQSGLHFFVAQLRDIHALIRSTARAAGDACSRDADRPPALSSTDGALRSSERDPWSTVTIAMSWSVEPKPIGFKRLR